MKREEIQKLAAIPLLLVYVLASAVVSLYRRLRRLRSS